jgi:putative nucleotidyltransferase with HDIG domain
MSKEREAAWELLCEYTKSENLRRHALAVEAAMRHYAEHFGEDVERWGACGLLHDFDYERFPTAEEHPYRGAEILRQRGYDEEFVRAVLSHASYTGVPRESLMARALFAVDELTGFLIAIALVRPDRTIANIKPKSVKKKLKDKAFARAVNRDEIRTGAAELGLELDEHVNHVVAAMASIAEQLGFPG